MNHAGAMTIGNRAAVQKIGVTFAITALCAWYVFSQIKLDDLVRADNLDFRWMVFATAIMTVQSLLAGLRWSRVANALGLICVPPHYQALL